MSPPDSLRDSKRASIWTKLDNFSLYIPFCNRAEDLLKEKSVIHASPSNYEAILYKLILAQIWFFIRTIAKFLLILYTPKDLRIINFVHSYIRTRFVIRRELSLT